MRRLLSLVFLLLTHAALAAPPGPGYHASVNVSAPTRLDWTFALSNRSLPEVPDGWLPADYDATKQSYELFVPARPDPKKALGLVVFISPSEQPAGFKQCEAACKDLGLLFVGVRGAGNDCPGKKRVRIILDVLDDVRRQFPIDPDRTYLAGFSGGGRMACLIGFALPEYFGGVLPICASGDLREETWLRHRVRDRLSVALLTGDTDFNRGEVERLRGPYLKDVGVRARVWVQPKLGHGIPDSKTILEAVKWLDEAAPKRAELAKSFPASRAVEEMVSREDQARALLGEGRGRLAKKETLYSGLMQIQGVLQRWPDLTAADTAKTILLEYENKAEKPWEVEDVAEQRAFLLARAKALDAYAAGELPPQYAGQRQDMLKQAIEFWKQIEMDAGADAEVLRQAKKRIPELEKLLK